MVIRGGQISVKPDLPAQSTRTDCPSIRPREHIWTDTDIRGGQKTVKPDPPNQSVRTVRLLAYIWTDTDTDILNIRITDK